eukprot:gene12485-12619_t
MLKPLKHPHHDHVDHYGLGIKFATELSDEAQPAFGQHIMQGKEVLVRLGQGQGLGAWEVLVLGLVLVQGKGWRAWVRPGLGWRAEGKKGRDLRALVMRRLEPWPQPLLLQSHPGLCQLAPAPWRLELELVLGWLGQGLGAWEVLVLGLVLVQGKGWRAWVRPGRGWRAEGKKGRDLRALAAQVVTRPFMGAPNSPEPSGGGEPGVKVGAGEDVEGEEGEGEDPEEVAAPPPPPPLGQLPERADDGHLQNISKKPN